MSFVIDESKVRRLLEKTGGKAYTVTVSNLGASVEHFPHPLFSSGVFSTVSAALPSMSSDTRDKLSDLRQRIVESGTRLMTTEELDNEIAERKGRLD
jgi:hypothetical protein